MPSVVNFELPSNDDLRTWQANFLALNESRLEHASSLMNDRQAFVLEALTVLLHCNSPKLPGFVDHQTPHGFRHYKTNERDDQAIKKFTHYLDSSTTRNDSSLRGLYIMGSLGSVAQTRYSDIDAWLCVSDELGEEPLKKLSKKCKAIEKWAQQQNVELHIFVMNLNQFQSRENTSMSTEDCGSSQHFLLLDEFYRSALWLAGYQPKWWLIPIEYESCADEYWQALCEQGLVSSLNWLDIGNVPNIPVTEFIGAGLWQLRKSLSSPYKSLLKLLLNRHYAAQYPSIKPLCWDLKHRVHNGHTQIEQCDAYLLMLDRIQNQLIEEGNQERLDIARRAFYFKTKLTLSNLNKDQRRNWAAQMLKQLCGDWQWDDELLAELDERPNWPATRVQQERNDLVSEMLSSYRFIAAFTQAHTTELSIRKQDMTLLGNQLYAAFDAQPGKITKINPNISQLETCAHVCFCHRDGIWYFIPHRPDKSRGLKEQTLKQSDSLMELLYFAHLNNLINKQTETLLEPAWNIVSQYELKKLVMLTCVIPIETPDESHFLSPPIPTRWVAVVNVGHDPQRSLTQRGMQKISNRDDALGFSFSRENLIKTVDLLSINSWGEWQNIRFDGENAIFECIEYMLKFLPQAQQHGWPNTGCYCFCASRSNSIASRTNQIVQNVMDHFIEHPKNPYIIEAAGQFYVFENKENQQLGYRTFNGESALVDFLSTAKKDFCRYALEDNALRDNPFREAINNAQANEWRVFFYRNKQSTDVYFVDDKGAIIFNRNHQSTPRKTLEPLMDFLFETEKKLHARHKAIRHIPIKLFEITWNKRDNKFNVKRQTLADKAITMNPIHLSCIIQKNNTVNFDCNGKNFSTLEHGQEVFNNIARHINGLRNERIQYPFYVSEIKTDHHRIIDILNLKYTIEHRINTAVK